MITSLVFECGLAATVLAAVGVAGYLNGPLRKQLLELCGTSAAPVSPLIAIAQQLKWGFIGLVASVLTMGWILSRFIARASVAGPSSQPEKK